MAIVTTSVSATTPARRSVFVDRHRRPVAAIPKPSALAKVLDGGALGGEPEPEAGPALALR